MQDDSTNNCLPKTIFGFYNPGSSLTTDNYLQVEVKVDEPGTFTIYTDTVNGYYFHTSGTFSSRGLITVNLPGFGKPLNYGTDNFTVFFDTGNCNFSIDITDTIPTPAQYSFLGDSCMIDSLLGFYIKGIPVSDTARLSFPADVKTPGSYIIYTDTVNGYSFSASGVFTTSGLQNVTLRSYGTPQNLGTDLFKVTADSATCYFTAPVLSPVVPVVNDHFPVIQNSYWSYNDPNITGDTIARNINDQAAFNNVSYEVFTETNQANQQTESYFRKSGNNYYEYCSGDKYTNAFKFKTPVLGDLFFLKENPHLNEQWTSNIYTGIATDNNYQSIQYNFKCLDDNAYYIVNNVAFSNVYIVQMKPAILSQTGDYLFTGEETDIYYARGIGIIYEKTFAGNSFAEMKLRNWFIN